MKGLKEFLEALKEDEGLKAEVEKVQDDAEKVVEIAKKHGYEFIEDEYNDEKMAAVSGGFSLGAVGKFADGVIKKIDNDLITPNVSKKGRKNLNWILGERESSGGRSNHGRSRG